MTVHLKGLKSVDVIDFLLKSAESLEVPIAAGLTLFNEGSNKLMKETT